MTRNARGVASILAVLAELAFLASGVPGGGLARAGRDQTDQTRMVQATPTGEPTTVAAGQKPFAWLPLVLKNALLVRNVDVTFAVIRGERLALNAYLPDTSGSYPAVILIHGGCWSGGDKVSQTRLGERVAEWGYAACPINYRLAPEFPFPAGVEDVHWALAWVGEHAAEYGVDPVRIALMGTSGGRHLAALAGLAVACSSRSPAWELSCGDPATSVRVQAVVSCFGPVDLPFHARQSEGAGQIVATFLGRPCQDAPALCAAASPMTYVSSDAPPAFLTHGTADEAVSCANSARMYAALQAVGAEVMYLPVEGVEHSFILHLGTPEAETALQAIEAFLAEVFSGP